MSAGVSRVWIMMNWTPFEDLNKVVTVIKKRIQRHPSNDTWINWPIYDLLSSCTDSTIFLPTTDWEIIIFLNTTIITFETFRIGKYSEWPKRNARRFVDDCFTFDTACHCKDAVKRLASKPWINAFKYFKQNTLNFPMYANILDAQSTKFRNENQLEHAPPQIN